MALTTNVWSMGKSSFILDSERNPSNTYGPWSVCRLNTFSTAMAKPVHYYLFVQFLVSKCYPFLKNYIYLILLCFKSNCINIIHKPIYDLIFCCRVIWAFVSLHLDCCLACICLSFHCAYVFHIHNVT